MDNILMQNENVLIDDETKIMITKTNRGRKVNLFISGWKLSKEELKEHLKNLKKSLGCNGSVKKENIEGTEETVIHLQGNHIDKVKEYLNNNEIDDSDIIIKE